MSRERHIQQEFYDPAQIALLAVALSASNNSAALRCEGFNQLSLEINLSLWGAASAITFFLEYSNDATNWYRIQVGDIAATGVETLTDRQWSKAVDAAKKYAINISINAKYIRVAAFTGTGATTDVASVSATLGVV